MYDEHAQWDPEQFEAAKERWRQRVAAVSEDDWNAATPARRELAARNALLARRCSGVAAALALVGLIVWPLGIGASWAAMRAYKYGGGALAGAAGALGIMETGMTVLVVSLIIAQHT